MKQLDQIDFIAAAYNFNVSQRTLLKPDLSSLTGEERKTFGQLVLVLNRYKDSERPVAHKSCKSLTVLGEDEMQRTNTLYRVTTNENTLPFDEEAALGVLKYLDKDNLQELDDSNEKLEEHISDIDQVKNLSRDKELLVTSNKSLAEYNLKKEPELRQGREFLILQYEKTSKLKEEYDTLRSVLDSKSAGQSLDTTHALLQTKAAQSEEETDRLSERFLDKSIECEEFLEKYMEERTRTHLLKIKSEKLGDMIQRHQHESTWGGSAATPVLATHGGYPQRQANTAPYPIYGNTMPQLNMPPVSS